MAVLTVGATLAAASVLLLVLLRGSLEDPMRGEARARAADVVAALSQVPTPSTVPALAAPWPSLAQVLDGDGRVVASSAELTGRAPLLAVTPSQREPAGHTAFGYAGRQQQWRLDAVVASLRGRDVTVVVATSLAQVERSVRILTVALAVGLPVLVLAVAAMAWLLVGRALHPVEALRRQVAGFERVPTGGHVVPTSGDDEIGRLATTLDDLLDRLRSANARQGRFVADASHELRSPVANIRAALEVALAHPGSAPWPEVAEDVLEQNARMGGLVDDLLLLARAGAGTLRDDDRPVDLAAVLDRAAHPPAARRVPVRVRADGDVAVRGVGGQLERLVENLVANAERHASSLVTVTATSVGRWVELTVADDGPGIAVADRARILEPFVRLDDDRSRAGGGTGLGLAIAAEIVAAHGGTLAVGDAHPGAVFRVRLPAARRSQPPLIAPGVRSSGDTPRAAPEVAP